MFINKVIYPNVSSLQKSRESYVNNDGVIAIGTKLNELVQNNIKCVAIGDMGLTPINEDSFEKNNAFTDMLNIYSTQVRPKVKKLTQKR